MDDPIYDLDRFEPLFPLENGMAVSLDGRFSLRVGDNMAMDMDTGELHFTSPWPSQGSDPDEGP